MRKIRLAVEFVVLFVALPFLVTVYAERIPFFVIPILVVTAVACLLALLRDPDFDRKCLWNRAELPRNARRILLTFAIVAGLVAAAVAILRPSLLFDLPLRNSRIWLLIVIFYPVFSVYPQELIYRAFLFHRYRSILTTETARVIASALAFGYVHIVFRNPIAVLLTLAAGLRFACTYRRSRSLLCVWVEHALYGALIFTVGLGQFFFHGTLRLVSTLFAAL